MSQRLFAVAKIGVFLDGYAPSIEKDTKILTLALRVQPFDAKLALAIDEGIGGDLAIKAALFKMSSGEPKPHISRISFNIGCPAQNLHMYATPDSESRIMLPHVKIGGTYARTQKDINGYAFCFRASFGPVDLGQYEYIHDWWLGQRFVTFEEAEPTLDVVVDEQPRRGRKRTVNAEAEVNDAALRDELNERARQQAEDDKVGAHA